MDHCYDNSFTFFWSEQHHHEGTQYEYTRHACVFLALYFLSLCIQRKDFIAIALVRLALSAHKVLENVFNDLVWVNSEFKTHNQVAPGQSGKLILANYTPRYKAPFIEQPFKLNYIITL